MVSLVRMVSYQNGKSRQNGKFGQNNNYYNYSKFGQNGKVHLGLNVKNSAQNYGLPIIMKSTKVQTLGGNIGIFGLKTPLHA